MAEDATLLLHRSGSRPLLSYGVGHCAGSAGTDKGIPYLLVLLAYYFKTNNHALLKTILPGSYPVRGSSARNLFLHTSNCFFRVGYGFRSCICGRTMWTFVHNILDDLFMELGWVGVGVTVPTGVSVLARLEGRGGGGLGGWKSLITVWRYSWTTWLGYSTVWLLTFYCRA
jgi:hypothetical protein